MERQGESGAIIGEANTFKIGRYGDCEGERGGEGGYGSFFHSWTISTWIRSFD